MAVDGTWGRLNTHNERFKALRRKKLERREKKRIQNRLNNPSKKSSKFTSPKPITDPKVVERIKEECKIIARRQLILEAILFLLFIVILFGLSYAILK